MFLFFSICIKLDDSGSFFPAHPKLFVTIIDRLKIYSADMFHRYTIESVSLWHPPTCHYDIPEKVS